MNNQNREFIDWNGRIKSVDTFFVNLVPTEKLVLIDKGTTIIDLKKFIDSHLATVKANKGNNAFLPYLERLEKVQKIISVI
jgi:hypothetical protein